LWFFAVAYKFNTTRWLFSVDDQNALARVAGAGFIATRHLPPALVFRAA